MRFSKQRQAVYDVLSEADTHPDALWVYRKVQAKIPQIGLGTVYRNLNELCSVGLIKRVSAEGNAERYDAKVFPHAHFVCTCCGKIIDVDSSCVNVSCNLQGVERSEVTLYGICGDCRK